MKYKIGLGIFLFIMVAIGAWVSGFDFNERGDKSLLVFFLCNAGGMLGYLIGGVVAIEKKWERLENQ